MTGTRKARPRYSKVASKLGKTRTGQLLSTFGPGSIVDLPDRGSYVVLGLAGWREGDRIDEPNLERILGVERLLVPGSTKDGNDIPVGIFPVWHHCSNCGGLLRETTCRKQGCDREAPPSRFVTACRSGHLDEFPWSWWVHPDVPDCSGERLELDDSSGSNSLSDLWVVCRAHAARRSLRGALSPDAFRDFACRRVRPWLQDIDPDSCSALVTGVLRGASNVWFADSISALSLPRHSSPIHVYLKDDFSTLNRLGDEPLQRLVLRQLLAPTKFTIDEGIKAIQQHNSVIADASDLRSEEYEALKGAGAPPDLRPPAPNFSARVGQIPALAAAVVDRIVLVDRLREVNALRGFTRLEGPDPEDPGRVKGAPIVSGKAKWLPAREVFGEGIFVTFAEEPLRKWEKDVKVLTRARAIQGVYDVWRSQRELRPAPNAVTPRKIAMHTFAHLVIRELSLWCGYGISSLRERVYVDGEQRGVLIYTASADSDGSLGGLVAMGNPRQFGPVIKSIIEQARWCSQDPLCGERRPDSGGHLSAAACHACLLLPETSCEMSNRFLDRLALIGSDAPGYLASL
jgi:hypothetical protein